MKTEIKKPFGLQIAAKIAAKALKEGNSPASIVLYNLFSLQKNTIFPKDLDELYFNKPNQGVDIDKRIVVKLLDEMKRPQVDITQLLEKTISEGWVYKKNPPNRPETIVKKIVAKNKKPVTKMASKAVKIEPNIVIKKNKLSI